MGIFSRLLQLARDSRLALGATILCGFLAGLLIIGQASLLSHAIDQVFLGFQDLPRVLGPIRLILIIVLGRALLAWGSEVGANSLAVRIKSDLRQKLFDKIRRLGPAFTRRQRTGELVNAAVEGVEALDAYFSQYLPQLVIATSVPLSILLFVFPRDPLSGLILLVTAPLIPVFMYLIGKAAEVLTKRQWDTLGRLSAHFLDSLQGLTTLKELGRSKEYAQSIAESSEHFRDATLGALRVTFLSALVLELVATVSTALVAVEVGLRLLYGHLAFQPALFLLLLAPEFYIPLRMLGLRFHAGMAGTSAARRIFELLDIREERTENGLSGREADLLFSTLNLSALSYTYPGETQPTLQDINLEIHAGEHIALVGSSGVGKSTLAWLLLRFLEPQSGRLMICPRSLGIGDQSSKEISPDAWRSMFAWIPQDPALFHDTIAANLRLAKPDATLDELQHAAGQAQLDGFIQSLPDGYETLIGEQGARLSAGQAQRLALARALLKGAPILVLDEPTSSLDPQQESMIEVSLCELSHSRTMITIAHRLNTVIQADRIVVLEGGRIIETGTHRELVARNGVYAGMVGVSSKVKSLKSKIDSQDAWTGRQQANVPSDIRPSTFDSVPSANLQSSIINQKSKILVRLLGFLRGSWGWVALSVLLGALTVGSNIGLMGTSAYLISSAALHPQLGTLQVAIVGVRFFGIARGIFRYAERLTSHNVTFRLLARLRVWFYQVLEPLAPARLMEYRSGDLLGRIVSDVDALENFYVRVISPPLVAALIAAAMAVFFGQYSSVLGWTYLAFMLLLGLGIPLLASHLSRRTGAELVTRRASLQSRLVEGIQGLADLLAFGRGADYAGKLHDEGKLYGFTQKQLASLNGFSNALTVLLVNLGMLAMLVLAIPLVRNGQIPGVMLAVLTLAASAGFEAVMPLPLAAQTLSSSRQAARRLFEIVDAKPEVEDGRVQGIEIGEQRTEIRERRTESKALFSTLCSSALYFSYPHQPQPALEDISFQLNPGRRIAIVGPSGAGKTTLANLLLRFWDFSHGQILLDGRDLHDYAQEDIRRQFGFISQRTYFFNDTLRRNLLLARPGATDSELDEATRRAEIHDFILGLPMGYDTFIGERGFRLSAGERQRLALARLFLKDAPILLLDEPTANLDSLNERRILDTLFRTTSGRSLLLITHRLVGLDNMDEILVLERGRIIERGGQAELLARAGLFARMWELQNRLLYEE